MPAVDLADILGEGEFLKRSGDELVGAIPGGTPEDTVDAVAAALVAGPNVEIAYDDTANTITVSATSIGGAGGHASFTFNSATTEPPTGNQLRLNNASQTAATRLWVSQTTTDGLDVSVGLAKVLAGHQIYFQDFDDASKWVKYSVTADGVDDGSYYDYTVAYHSGPANVPFQKVEFQPIAPGTIGVPPGGATGQMLAKTAGTDYTVGWTDAGPASTTVDTIWTGNQAAYDAIGTKDPATLYFIT